MENQNQQTQSPQSPNQTPSPVKAPTGSKIIPIVLGIVTVVVIAIVAYLLGTKQSQPIVQNQQTIVPTTIPSPTSDPTTNWKTFTAETITFEYPNNWRQGESIGEGNQYGSYQLETFYIEASDYGSKKDNLTFNFKTNYSLDNKYKSRTMSDYVNELDKILNASGSKYQIEQITSKNGIDFIIYQEVGKDVSDHTIRATSIKNEYDYKLTLSAQSNNTLEKFRPIFDQILSTFKFTP